MPVKAMSLAAVFRGVVAASVLATTGIVAAPAVAALSNAKEAEAFTLANSIAAVVLQAQASAQAQGLSYDAAVAAEEVAIQQVIIQSGATPDVVLAAMHEARKSLTRSVNLTRASVTALGYLMATIQMAADDYAGTGYAASTSNGGTGFGNAISAPPSTSGGGGSDYRPPRG